MGHTNSTANLALPQFIGTDKPTWLGDINGAFSALDSYAGTNDAAVAAAASDASSAISQASAAVTTANTANTTAGNASTTANNAIGVANTANAIAGTVDAKVGLLANLNTTDRSSIVNAINEVNNVAKQLDHVTVASDGIKTVGQIYNELFANIDLTKISFRSILVVDSGSLSVVDHLMAYSSSEVYFTRTYTSALTDAFIEEIKVSASSEIKTANCISNTISTNTGYVPAAGSTYSIYY